MTEAEILDAMAERLQDKGWIQGLDWDTELVLDQDGKMVFSYGATCLRGAGLLCAGSQAEKMYAHSKVVDLLCWAIAELFPERVQGSWWNTVIKFNDHEDTTFEDVMLVTKHARGQAGWQGR